MAESPSREAMDRYIATWTAVLDHIGGWPPEEIAKVFNYDHPHFRSAWFLHDSPLEHVSAYLVTNALKGVPGVEISMRIETAIMDGVSDVRYRRYPDRDPNYDWGAARERVKTTNREMELTFLNL